MIAWAVWIIILIWWAAPAFPSYEWWFWALTAFVPPLIVIPIIEALA